MISLSKEFKDVLTPIIGSLPPREPKFLIHAHSNSYSGESILITPNGDTTRVNYVGDDVLTVLVKKNIREMFEVSDRKWRINIQETLTACENHIRSSIVGFLSNHFDRNSDIIRWYEYYFFTAKNTANGVTILNIYKYIAQNIQHTADIQQVDDKHVQNAKALLEILWQKNMKPDDIPPGRRRRRKK